MYKTDQKLLSHLLRFINDVISLKSLSTIDASIYIYLISYTNIIVII